MNLRHIDRETAVSTASASPVLEVLGELLYRIFGHKEYRLRQAEETAVSTGSPSGIPRMWGEGSPPAGVFGGYPDDARVTRRVVYRPGEVVFEEIVEPLPAEEPQVLPASPPYKFITTVEPGPVTAAEYAILADWRAGRAEWVGGPYHPEMIGRRLPLPSPSRPVKLSANGRIILSE